MQLNQIFYGNAGFGYKVLGTSDESLSGKAAEMCRAVGTPDGLSDLFPFLLSVPDGDRLFMVCCSPGKADGVGRKTLFFHILVGNRDEATAAGINAFSLWESKRFSDVLPGGSILPISVFKLFGESVAPAWNGDGLRLPRKRPANAEIRQLVGSRVNDVAWATFSFCNLEVPFELYAVSEHVSLPDSKKAELSQDGKTPEDSPVKKRKSSVQKSVVWMGFLAVSVLMNVFLLTKKENEQENQPPQGERKNGLTEAVSNIEKTRSKGLKQEGYRQALADLREKFPKDSVISDPDSRIGNSKVRDYVKFVNENILKDSTQGE